jgi:hypothetical protein
VDARSLLSVLTLAACHGDTLELTADGEQAQGALDELARLLGSDLDDPGPGDLDGPGSGDLDGPGRGQLDGPGAEEAR